MPIFDLECVVTVSAFTKVKARSLEEAIKISERRGVRIAMSGDADPAEVWVIEEPDGAPQGIVAA